MKLAAVAGPLGALKDARNKLQADLSRIGPKLATLWPEMRLKRRNRAGRETPATTDRAMAVLSGNIQGGFFVGDARFSY